MDTPIPPDDNRRRSGERRARKRRSVPLIPPGAIARTAPIVVFTLLAILSPLLFGSADRIVQVGLLVLFAVGIFLRPPSLIPLSQRANFVIVALLGILLLKEFAPWQWFGGAEWRKVFASEMGVKLPSTHNPEPQRALDALLAGIVGLVWFQWARTLASERGTRRVLGWALFGAGAVVALVCFAMGRREVDAGGGMIYGFRSTTSWSGWGPFPNKNHTACFLAMSFLVGTGCVAWAALKRRYALLVSGSLGLLLIGGALLASQSRGGLAVALGVGLAVFATFVLVRFFSLRTLVIVLTAGTLLLTGVLLFGGDVVARFQSHDAGAVSNNLRVAIWKDTVSMWKDAPLFGHGLETFPRLFPIYQTVNLDGAYAPHPESSWLAWMAEVGIVPLLIAVVALGVFIVTNVRGVLARRGGYFISIGALAGFAGFLAHCAVDVPGHRWGTAIFALALLAVASPVRSPDEHVPPSSRLSAFVPIAVAGFWALPFMGSGPLWSPVEPLIMAERESAYAARRAGSKARPTLEEWQALAAYFPLDWEVQQSTARRELENQIPLMRARRPVNPQWQWRFEVVSRLTPSLYRESMQAAYDTAPASKGLAIGYWQQAVDKAQFAKIDIFRIAIAETRSFPTATGLWDTFCAERPELLLTYASLLVEALNRPIEESRQEFDMWWEQRALTAVLTEEERITFNRCGYYWASLEQVDLWIKKHGALRKLDYRHWATLLHKLGDDSRAWDILSGIEKESKPIELPRGGTIASARELLVNAPDNFSSIAGLVSALEKAGEVAEARQIVLSTARRPNAPIWFRSKSAFALAAEGKKAAAVELMLR